MSQLPNRVKSQTLLPHTQQDVTMFFPSRVAMGIRKALGMHPGFPMVVIEKDGRKHIRYHRG